MTDADTALRVEHLYKKFRKGEVYNSLRDLIPALSGRMFRQRELNKADREFWALEDVSFDVERGEAFGIIGPNGAGKSTILKLLSRVMKPTSGSIHVNGRISGLIELAAGFHPDLTGRENIYLYGAVMGMSRREVSSGFDSIVDFSGLAEFIDTPVKRYSSGMFARLGFAVASHVNPDVLLVDEVLSVGDYVFQRKCVDRMNQVISSGTTVLFVSHNLKNIAEFCTRCLLLERGKIVAVGPTAQVIPAYLGQCRNGCIPDSHAKAVVISKVEIHDEYGECLRFHTGQKAWVEIEVSCHSRTAKLSVSLYITDETGRSIFDTSTERLGYGTFTLEAGDTFRCVFEVHLNMAHGIFHPSVLIYRYDTETTYDRWDPAATIYVSCDEDVRGNVHCFPKVVYQKILRSSEANVGALRDTACEKNSCASGHSSVDK